LRRSDLEHLIRAAGRIAGERELVIIGSQSVLGQFPDAPVALLMSMEADLYPRAHPELADKVDGAIGEGSAFHQVHGYYAQGVGPDTATLPRGWQRRLVRVENQNTNGYAGVIPRCGLPGYSLECPHLRLRGPGAALDHARALEHQIAFSPVVRQWPRKRSQ
jgi:hypothetical protein